MTDETHVGAIDQGTTGTRFVVFDRRGEPVGSAYERHEQRYLHPGWVEHDPVELWERTRSVVTAGLADAEIGADRLAALGITNQRETTVLWDATTGEPLHDAIVWQDRRTTDRIEALREAGHTEWIRATTGLEPDAYFSATKAEWLLDHADGETDDLRARAAAGELRLGTVDAWLLDNLTGVHATDVTNASRTMLFDIHALEWDEELLALFDVPRELLPTVRPSIDPEGFGRTDAAGFLGVEVPVTAVLGDQQAALFGQTGFEAGAAKNTYGTGSFVLLNTGAEAATSEHGLLTTVAYQRAGEPAQYALEGSIFVTGAAIEWLVDVGVIDDPAETAALARSVDSTDGVYLVPAFAGLGAPHWNGRARGTIVGLTRGTRREHLARAALEAIAFRTRDVVDAMATDTGVELDALRVDGGAAANDVLCQLQADVLGTDVLRPRIGETTALGAAYAAGLGAGYWATFDDLRDRWTLDRAFEPRADADEVDARYARWGAAVERSLDWAADGSSPGDG